MSNRDDNAVQDVRATRLTEHLIELHRKWWTLIWILLTGRLKMKSQKSIFYHHPLPPQKKLN